MPIYEYECDACHNRFERWQGMHDMPVKTCPDCGGATRRIFHPVGIIFKGSGFYVTDNRKPSASASPAPKEGKADEPAKKEAVESTVGQSSSTESKAPAEAKPNGKTG